MGVDTRAYIPNLTPKDLTKFMRVFDKNAKLEDVEMYKGEMWYIHFLDRQMTIHIVDLDIEKAKTKAEKNLWEFEETDEYLHIKQDGWPENTTGVSVKLGSNEQAIAIIKIICLSFGGYFKPEDYKGGPYDRIKKDRHQVIREVFNDPKI